MERPRRKVRFARLIDRRVRVLGGPKVRAAFGGIQSPPWSLLAVVPQSTTPFSSPRIGGTFNVVAVTNGNRSHVS
jgi:hypothetical protein